MHCWRIDTHVAARFFIFIASILLAFMISGAAQAARVLPKPVLGHGLALGDVDGDGLEDFVQFAKNRIFVFRTDSKKTGILHKYVDQTVRRIVLGDFATSGREHGRDQVCVWLGDNTIRCYASSDDNRDLWWWFSQPSFMGLYDDAIAGDFDGDGGDDILLHNRYTGAIKLYTRIDNRGVFVPMPDFHPGNLEHIDLKNKQLFAGEFGQASNRADLLVVDPSSGAISRYDSATDNQGKKTFWWAFHTRAEFVNEGEMVSVANIDGGTRDGVVLSTEEGAYRFFKAEYDNGNLKAVSGSVIRPGNLDDHRDVTPFFGKFAAFDNEAGSKRDDVLLYKSSNQSIVRIDARYDVQARRHTYWWAYTGPRPSLNEGWPKPRKDKWLVLKCKLKDIYDGFEKESYYLDLFTKRGAGKESMWRYAHDMSYGMIDLDPDLPQGYKTIDATLKDATEKVIRDGNLEHNIMRWGLNDMCMHAWGIDNADQYKAVISIFNKTGIDMGEYSGGAIPYRGVVLHKDAFHLNMVSHEAGHTFGLPHSFDDTRNTVCKTCGKTHPRPYYDPYDIMGGLPEIRFQGEYKDSGPGIHGFNRQRMGALPSGRVTTLTISPPYSTEEHRLVALDKPECHGPLLIVLNAGSSGPRYAIDFREKQGWDRKFPQTAVHIRRIGKHPHDNDDSTVTYLQTTAAGNNDFLAGDEFKGSFATVKVKHIDEAGGIATLDITY